MTKTNPKKTIEPVKKRTLSLSPEIGERVKVISDMTGLTMQKVVEALLDAPLTKMEEGGTLVISKDGITIGNPAPKLTPHVNTAMPKIQRREMQEV